MIEVQIQSDIGGSTIIPNQFIDTYMPEANGEFVKVYLYLLRSVHTAGFSCTISAIADHFNHTENDVVRALTYWQKQNLLTLSYNEMHEITGIRLCSLDSVTAINSSAETEFSQSVSTVSAVSAESESEVIPAASVVTEVVRTPSKRSYSLDEILQFRQDPNFEELLFVVETYMKHPLSENDINTIIFWYEDLQFSSELIVYLLEYCISKGHSSIRYMEKVALGWHSSGITTVEQAKADAAIHSQAYYAVMKALGITGRSLVDSEITFIRKWTKDYAFDLPIIQEACRRTMTATHQPSFEYTDSILTNWNQNHVHTQADIDKLDSQHQKRKAAKASADVPVKKNSFTNFNQRSYDYDKLEELLLTSNAR